MLRALVTVRLLSIEEIPGAVRLARKRPYALAQIGPDTETMDLARLDVLDGVFAAERDGFVADVLFLRDPAEGRKAAAAAKQKHPGIWEWMDSVEKGFGTVKFEREAYLRRRARKRP